MKLKFPDYAEKCIKILEKNGFEAYLVGGCVRDRLLDRPLNDIDITTNALPEEITEIFEHTIPTGIKHGTVTVIYDNRPIEITTYRTESGYSDHRHPEQVKFVSNLRDDLARRDFTVNAMAYNKGLVDLFGGMKDLEGKVIRTVGNPEERFREDALRILRAYRFCSVLDFRMTEETEVSAKRLSPLMNSISGERVLGELSKLAKGISPHKIYEFINLGALESFGISGFADNIKTVAKIADPNIPDDYKAAIFLSMTEHNIDLIKSRLKPDGRLLKRLTMLDSDIIQPKNKADIKHLLNKYDADAEIYLYKLLIHGKVGKCLDELKEIKANGEPYKISHLTIGGEDVKALGICGEAISKALNTALEFVIENPKRNTAAELIKLIKN